MSGVVSFSTQELNWSTCLLIMHPSVVSTLYMIGPICWSTIPGIHLSYFNSYSLVITRDPAVKERALECASWYLFCLACLWVTCSFVSGSIRSNLVCSLHLINSSPGETPVVEWGIALYSNKNSASQCHMDRWSFRLFAFSEHFNVCTNLSARPLVAGWYGADRMCLMWFLCRNCVNSDDINCSPFSETSCSTKP